MTILILGNINHEYSDISAPYDMEQVAWKPPVVSETESVYGIEVAKDVTSIVQAIDVSSDTQALYSMRWFLSQDTNIVFSIDVENDVTSIVFGIDVSRDVTSSYNVANVYVSITSEYSIRGPIVSDLQSEYDLANYFSYGDVISEYGIKAESNTPSEYSIRELITIDLNCEYNLLTFLTSDANLEYDIKGTNPVYRDFKSIYTMYDEAREDIVLTVVFSVVGE